MPGSLPIIPGNLPKKRRNDETRAKGGRNKPAPKWHSPVCQRWEEIKLKHPAYSSVRIERMIQNEKKIPGLPGLKTVQRFLWKLPK
jgi:excisionase family DNA binding protein